MVRRKSYFAGVLVLLTAAIGGCGGHEGGQLNIPANNQYQVSAAEEAQRVQARSAAFEAKMEAERQAAEAAAAAEAAQAAAGSNSAGQPAAAPAAPAAPSPRQGVINSEESLMNSPYAE